MQALTEHDIEPDGEAVIDDQIVAFRWGACPVAVDILNDKLTTRAAVERMIAALTAVLPALK